MLLIVCPVQRDTPNRWNAAILTAISGRPALWLEGVNNACAKLIAEIRIITEKPFAEATATLTDPNAK